MRICPKCGFEDPYWWRPRNSRVYCEFTKSETLEYNNPEIVDVLELAYVFGKDMPDGILR